MLTNVQPTIVNEETPRSDQPKEIITSLKEHQLAMIHEMRELETPGRKRLKTTHETPIEYSFETQFGCVCDKVGSGKSLTVLGTIAQEPFLKPSINVINNYRGYLTIYQEIPEVLPVNILVVPHGIINQWVNYLDKDTNLDYDVVKNKKTLGICKENFELYFKKPDENDALIDKHLYIVSSTFYNKLGDIFEGKTVSRLVVDEVDSINVKRAVEIKAQFTWFISSSKTILQNPNGTVIYTPHTYTAWNGNVYNVQRRTLINRMSHNGFFRNTLSTISSSPLTDRIYLKSDDDFVKKSFALPDYTIRIVKCKDTSTHNVLNGVIDNDTMDMINAGDIKGAMENLGCKVENKEGMITFVTKKLETQLSDKIKEYEYKSQITFSSESAKQTALENIQKQMDEIKKKIECIKSRILENNTCPICCDDIKNRVIVSCCNNPFCFECISLSLSHQPKCPMCREPITPKDFIVLGDSEEDCDCAGSKEEETDEDREKIENFKIYFNETLKEENKKILIFSKYDACFDNIKEFLSSLDVKYSELKGHSSRINNIVKNYKSNSSPDKLDVLLLNAEHFGSGLNLENTTDIFLYHNMGGPMTNQVIGRAQRPGRTSPLRITRFCYENEV